MGNQAWRHERLFDMAKVTKERPMTDEHRAAISDAKRKSAENVMKRTVRNLCITDRERYVDSPEFGQSTKGSNSAKAFARREVQIERIQRKVNPDGSPMSLQQEIDARLVADYGTAPIKNKDGTPGPSAVDKLRQKLAGGGKGPAMSAEDAFALLA